MHPIVLIVGTRPEGIKMMPLYFACKKAGLPTVLCSTAQHSDLLQEVYDLFGVTPDYQLDIMKPNQDLFHVTQEVLARTKEVFVKEKPALVIVQGDTTSSMAAALSAFYLGIPVAHVEAGLRTDDIHNPFPEEMNRRFIGSISNYHFAPTATSVANLLAEGIARNSIFCTGNTVVDALRIIKEKIDTGVVHIDPALQMQMEQCKSAGQNIALLTVHRRESFNGGVHRILAAVKDFALAHPDVFFFYPYHPNPNVVQALEETGLHAVKNIFLTKPMSYKELVYTLVNADWIATDSGGIQEEATSLGKKVLVLREKTERLEGVWAGYATLVGTDTVQITQGMNALVANKLVCKTNAVSTIYGDGYAADMIVQIIKNSIGL